MRCARRASCNCWRHQAEGRPQAGGGLVQALMAGIELALHAIAEAACEQIQRPSQTSRGWATSSAAAVGVGARRSAQKSAMVKSVSCPTR